jgi:hypothetical protein
MVHASTALPIAVLGLAASAQAVNGLARRSQVSSGTHGAVACEVAVCSEAGLSMLEAGGSVTDGVCDTCGFSTYHLTGLPRLLLQHYVLAQSPLITLVLVAADLECKCVQIQHLKMRTHYCSVFVRQAKTATIPTIWYDPSRSLFSLRCSLFCWFTRLISEKR